MCDTNLIHQLYSNALLEHQIKYKATEADIRTAIQNMKEVYKPNPGSLSDEVLFVADYNDAAHRCAYLHKYAPFHTALVADFLVEALQKNIKVFNDIIYPSGQFNICSLGGGPGSDIFGVLSVLYENFDLFQVSATIIDCMENWNEMFYDLITQLRYGNYGGLSECVEEQYFDWKYLQHNLLSNMNNQVNQAIGRAHLVTMIKFVSAASCKDTSAMIRKIFRTLKTGSLVLFIDNAGGGFHQVLKKEARDCNLTTVFGPLMHRHYVNHDFNVKRFGYTPCLETKVTVQIWRKNDRNISNYLELNEPSEPRAAVNVLPALRKINQQKAIQASNFKPETQKSNVIKSRTFYNVTLPESGSNQREFHDVPNASLHTAYEYYERIICAKSLHSYMPGNQPSVTNHNSDTFRVGSCSTTSQHPKQPSYHPQPRSITSTLIQPQINSSLLSGNGYSHRINSSQISNSFRPEIRPSVSNTKRNGTCSVESKKLLPKQPTIRTEPRITTSTSQQPERNQINTRRGQNENVQEIEDCCCCIIS